MKKKKRFPIKLKNGQTDLSQNLYKSNLTENLHAKFPLGKKFLGLLQNTENEGS